MNSQRAALLPDSGRPANENLRQAVHLALGAGAFLLVWIPSWAMLCAIAVAMIIVLFAGHVVRHPTGTSGFFSLLRYVFRPQESWWNNGGIFYLAGVAIAIVLLPWYAALAGWLVLAGGDSFANVLGRNFPVYRFGRKSLGGMLGFLFGSLIFWPAIRLVYPVPLSHFAMAAAFSALGETFLPGLNDNIWLAPVSGALIIIAGF